MWGRHTLFHLRNGPSTRDISISWRLQDVIVNIFFTASKEGLYLALRYLSVMPWCGLTCWPSYLISKIRWIHIVQQFCNNVRSLSPVLLIKPSTLRDRLILSRLKTAQTIMMMMLAESSQLPIWCHGWPPRSHVFSIQSSGNFTASPNYAYRRTHTLARP